MMEYRVTWTIEVYAENPSEAAELALGTQRDPASTATFFEVQPFSVPCTDRGEMIEL